jgi:hypothetical protein
MGSPKSHQLTRKVQSMAIVVVGIDLAKNAFAVRGVNEAGNRSSTASADCSARWVSRCPVGVSPRKERSPAERFASGAVEVNRLDAPQQGRLESGRLFSVQPPNAPSSMHRHPRKPIHEKTAH